MNDCIVIRGQCTNCRRIIVDDGIGYKAVPNKKWLTDNGYVFIAAPVKQTFWACDGCSNNYAVDLCDCGSGNKVHKCKCGAGKPIVTLGSPLPNAIERFQECLQQRRKRRTCQA